MAKRPSKDQLRDLPPPRRTGRSVTLALMIVTALLSGALAWSLRREAVFTLRERQPVEVGDLGAAALGPEQDGRLVRARVEVGPAALSFRRPFEGASHRVAAVPTPPGEAPRWVVFAVPDALDGPRFVPPSLVAGRLVRVEDAGPRYRGLAAALRGLGNGSEGGWVLLDGDGPEDLGWIFGLELLLGAFFAFTVGSAISILRPVRSRVG